MSASGTAAPAGGDAAALPDGHVTIVGAGLVGLCTAAWLQRDGRPVRLVDPGGPGEGASYGNAGIVSTSGVTPVAMPGIVRRVPGMLLDPLGPLAIRPAYLPRLLPWLARFIAASRPADVERIARSLAALSVDAIAHYEPLLEAADAGDLLQRNGSLYLYETEEQWRGVQGEIALRQRAGAEIELLGAEEIRQMVPALGPRYAGAIFAPTSGHIANPLALSQRLAGLVERQGGSFLRARVGDFVYRGGRLAALTSDAGEFQSKDWISGAEAHGFGKTTTAPYAPGSHARVERKHQDLLEAIRRLERTPKVTKARLRELGFVVANVANKTVGSRKNKHLTHQVNLGKSKYGLGGNTQQLNSMSVYQNDLVTEPNSRESRRMGRGSSGIGASGATGIELSNITKEHREMRTSSATAGNTNTEFKLLSMTGLSG